MISLPENISYYQITFLDFNLENDALNIKMIEPISLNTLSISIKNILHIEYKKIFDEDFPSIIGKITLEKVTDKSTLEFYQQIDSLKNLFQFYIEGDFIIKVYAEDISLELIGELSPI